MKPRLYAAWGTSSLHLVTLSSVRVAIGGLRPLLPMAPLGSGSSLTSQTPSFPRWPGNRWEAAGPRRKHSPLPTHLPGAPLVPCFLGRTQSSPHGAGAHLPSRAPFCGFFMSFGYYLLLSNPPPCFLQLGLLSHFSPPPAPSTLGLCGAPLLLHSPWRPDPSSHAVHHPGFLPAPLLLLLPERYLHLVPHKYSASATSVTARSPAQGAIAVSN